MPHFDSTVTLGNIITGLMILGGLWMTALRMYAAIDKRLTRSEDVLSAHSDRLTSHVARMDKQDEAQAKISGDLNRILGRMEAAQTSTIALAEVAAKNVLAAAEAVALERIRVASMIEGKKA